MGHALTLPVHVDGDPTRRRHRVHQEQALVPGGRGSRVKGGASAPWSPGSCQGQPAPSCCVLSQGVGQSGVRMGLWGAKPPARQPQAV